MDPEKSLSFPILYKVKKKRRKLKRRSLIKFAKENCFLLAPIWILWTYIVSLLLTSHTKSRATLLPTTKHKLKLEYTINSTGEKYSLEYEDSGEETTEVSSFHHDGFTNRILGNLNYVKIARIYDFLGANYDQVTRTITIRSTMHRTNFSKFLKSNQRIVCGEKMKLGKILY